MLGSKIGSAALIWAGLGLVIVFSVPERRSAAQTGPVVLAPGFEFNIFADPSRVADFSNTFSGPTALAFDSRGRLFVATYAGKILMLLDNDDDGNVDQVKTFASGIPVPLGLEFRSNGDLFATSNILRGPGRVVRLRDLDGDDRADETTVVLDGLPSEGHHQTDRIKFGPDGLLYIGQGSSTDNGEPEQGELPERPLNAKILRLDVDNFTFGVFASGLRNPFGMAFHPESGALFSTDAGSGELCQLPPCPTDPPPFDEVNWVVEGGKYGFPKCEGAPAPGNPYCEGVRPPLTEFLPHLTPTSIAFYTGPQAGESRNQMLVTIYKRFYGQGGDLRRFTLTGNPQTGFQATEVKPPIAEFGIIDPFDGPVDTAIDPISGDIYVARFDPVVHRDVNEHHHFIYRIHRAGSDALPFIAPVRPETLRAGSGDSSIAIMGRHLKPGAVVQADQTPLATRQGASIFELIATLPAAMLSTGRTLRIEVMNPEGTRSNAQELVVIEEPRTPRLDSLTVTKKGRVIATPVVGMRAKKLRLIATGVEFEQGAQLLAGGVALELESASATELVGRFTAAMVSAPGEIRVQVRNPNGRLSNAMTLTVAAGL